MRKIKKIATTGIVGTLLFVSSGSVRAQDTVFPTKTTQRNEIPDYGVAAEESVATDVGISAYDEIDMQGDAKEALYEQGFSPSQIQKLSRRS